MAYISRTGNLAGVPTLRDGDRGVYTYARVIVADRLPREGGGYDDGPSIGYDVAVSGSQAEQLVATAEASGNIRITFSGRYSVTAYQDPQNSEAQPIINHKVQADEIGVSLRGQRVIVPRDDQ